MDVQFLKWFAAVLMAFWGLYRLFQQGEGRGYI
jgi:hypothetical protein